MNSPPTGGRKEPLNSQNPKLAVGAQRAVPGPHVPTGSRAHGTGPCAWAPVPTGVKNPVSTGYPEQLAAAH